MFNNIESLIKHPFRSIRIKWLRNRIPLKKDSTQYVAHRGLSAEAPENTVRAFELAAARKYNAMETDIRRTKDHRLVLMHDASLKRMCKKDILVKDLTYDELKKIPIVGGNHPEKYKDDPKAQYVPLLSEYLTICKDSGMVPMMELKDKWNEEEPLDEDYLTDIVRQVKEVMGNSPTIYVSFNIRSLLGMQKVLEKDKITTVTLYHLVRNIGGLDLSWYRRHGIHLSIQGKANKLRDIRKAKKAGIRLVVWTVDDPDQARLYIREDVEWLASNRQLWN